MGIKRIKNYLTGCGLDFTFCLNRLICSGEFTGEFELCLSKKERPSIFDMNNYIIYKKEYDTEINYIKMIINTLYSIKKNEADIIWENYFYTGKKEVYYDRSVDYRHRLKASNNFYIQLKNIY